MKITIKGSGLDLSDTPYYAILEHDDCEPLLIGYPSNAYNKQVKQRYLILNSYPSQTSGLMRKGLAKRFESGPTDVLYSPESVLWGVWENYLKGTLGIEAKSKSKRVHTSGVDDYFTVIGISEVTQAAGFTLFSETDRYVGSTFRLESCKGLPTFGLVVHDMEGDYQAPVMFYLPLGTLNIEVLSGLLNEYPDALVFMWHSAKLSLPYANPDYLRKLPAGIRSRILLISDVTIPSMHRVNENDTYQTV